MALDFSKVNDRLESFNKSSQPQEKIDYTTIFWRPQEGKQVVRLVPSVVDPTYPFTEMKFHYNFDFPIPALSNFGKQDPVEEFVKELRKLGGDDNFDEARKYSPKTRVLAPVVVRGEEDKGVRFYEFGKMVYQELLGVMADEDYGDITAVQNGRDVTVEVIPAAETGKMFNTTTVRVKPNQTPLSDDAKLAESLLEDQKDVVSLFKKYTFEEMKGELQSYLKPAEEDGGKETEVKEAPSKGKKDLDSKLDELFD